MQILLRHRNEFSSVVTSNFNRTAVRGLNVVYLGNWKCSRELADLSRIHLCDSEVNIAIDMGSAATASHTSTFQWY